MCALGEGLSRRDAVHPMCSRPPVEMRAGAEQARGSEITSARGRRAALPEKAGQGPMGRLPPDGSCVRAGSSLSRHNDEKPVAGPLPTPPTSPVGLAPHRPAPQVFARHSDGITPSPVSAAFAWSSDSHARCCRTRGQALSPLLVLGTCLLFHLFITRFNGPLGLL